MVTVHCQHDPRVRDSHCTFPHKDPIMKGLCPHNHAEIYSLLSLRAHASPWVNSVICGLFRPWGQEVSDSFVSCRDRNEI